MPKEKISARELLADIRAGIDDPALMKKYELSAQGLQSACKKLVEAKALKQSEVDNRVPLTERTVDIVWKCPACGKPQTTEFDECPECGLVISKFDKAKETRRRERAGADVPASVLGIQFASIPNDFKRKIYPRLSWCMDWLNAYAIVQLVLAILAALIVLISMIKAGFSWAGLAAILVPLLVSVFSLLLIRAVAEGVRLGVDISASLVKSNYLLARILEKEESQ